MGWGGGGALNSQRPARCGGSRGEVEQGERREVVDSSQSVPAVEEADGLFMDLEVPEFEALLGYRHTPR
jgi:hypothetical protein